MHVLAGPVLLITEYCTHGDLLNFLRRKASVFLHQEHSSFIYRNLSELQHREHYQNSTSRYHPCNENLINMPG